MRVCEIFGPSIQGEGPEAGTPTIFLRLSGCNLSCNFCDTKYHKDGKEMSDNELEDIVNNFLKRGVRHITVTGGEPVLQEKELSSFLSVFEDCKLSLETNGTLLTHIPYHTIVVSPKKQSLNFDVLKQYSNHPNAYFKFVWENENDKWWENVISRVGINKERVYIMAEGKTRDEQLIKMPIVMDYCISKGYKFTPRIHVLAYNDRRGV